MNQADIDDTLFPVSSEKNTRLTVSDIELQLKEENLKSQVQDREERKNFAGKIYIMLCVFLAIVGLVLLMHGLNVWGFNLSETVLIALLATSSANVIGVFLFVVRYLFKANNSCPHCGMSHNFEK